MLHSISLANFTRELPSFAQIQLWKWVFLIKNLQKHKTENLHSEESLYVYALSPRCDGPMHSSGCRQLLQWRELSNLAVGGVLTLLTC